jgi:hypothetical protein
MKPVYRQTQRWNRPLSNSFFLILPVRNTCKSQWPFWKSNILGINWVYCYLQNERAASR